MITHPIEPALAACASHLGIYSDVLNSFPRWLCNRLIILRWAGVDSSVRLSQAEEVPAVAGPSVCSAAFGGLLQNRAGKGRATPPPRSNANCPGSWVTEDACWRFAGRDYVAGGRICRTCFHFIQNANWLLAVCHIGRLCCLCYIPAHIVSSNVGRSPHSQLDIHHAVLGAVGCPKFSARHGWCYIISFTLFIWFLHFFFHINWFQLMDCTSGQWNGAKPSSMLLMSLHWTSSASAACIPHSCSHLEGG